ncbi:hypothetical protein DFH07DRAFT_953238 [Mycena maculata]|uniref:Uncharacterized protein n=1 Tax=Mycena maculata TaxID=230809 RepID=A0AAD7NQY5_9AGAR|nr:hypothetical protein DFH07DRAFT_953238 [Mycena maculata]
MGEACFGRCGSPLATAHVAHALMHYRDGGFVSSLFPSSSRRAFAPFFFSSLRSGVFPAAPSPCTLPPSSRDGVYLSAATTECSAVEPPSLSSPFSRATVSTLAPRRLHAPPLSFPPSPLLSVASATSAPALGGAFCVSSSSPSPPYPLTCSTKLDADSSSSGCRCARRRTSLRFRPQSLYEFINKEDFPMRFDTPARMAQVVSARLSVSCLFFALPTGAHPRRPFPLAGAFACSPSSTSAALLRRHTPSLSHLDILVSTHPGALPDVAAMPYAARCSLLSSPHLLVATVPPPPSSSPSGDDYRAVLLPHLPTLFRVQLRLTLTSFLPQLATTPVGAQVGVFTPKSFHRMCLPLASHKPFLVVHFDGGFYFAHRFPFGATSVSSRARGVVRLPNALGPVFSGDFFYDFDRTSVLEPIDPLLASWHPMKTEPEFREDVYSPPLLRLDPIAESAPTSRLSSSPDDVPLLSSLLLRPNLSGLSSPSRHDTIADSASFLPLYVPASTPTTIGAALPAPCAALHPSLPLCSSALATSRHIGCHTLPPSPLPLALSSTLGARTLPPPAHTCTVIERIVDLSARSLAPTPFASGRISWSPRPVPLTYLANVSKTYALNPVDAASRGPPAPHILNRDCLGDSCSSPDSTASFFDDFSGLMRHDSWGHTPRHADLFTAPAPCLVRRPHPSFVARRFECRSPCFRLPVSSLPLISIAVVLSPCRILSSAGCCLLRRHRQHLDRTNIVASSTPIPFVSGCISSSLRAPPLASLADVRKGAASKSRFLRFCHPRTNRTPSPHKVLASASTRVTMNVHLLASRTHHSFLLVLSRALCPRCAMVRRPSKATSSLVVGIFLLPRCPSPPCPDFADLCLHGFSTTMSRTRRSLRTVTPRAGVFFSHQGHLADSSPVFHAGNLDPVFGYRINGSPVLAAGIACLVQILPSRSPASGTRAYPRF